MGAALLTRVAAEADTCVIDPAKPAHLPSAVKWHSTPAEINSQFTPDIIVIAVKPQHMANALPVYGKYQNSVFLSIAAGQTLARLSSLLGGGHYAIVRAMPNLPASIGQGISVAVANHSAKAPQRALCETILKSVGLMAWTDSENLLDAVTALSGSGPAYVFALTEAMAKAGEALGLPPELAVQLARQTVVGSGALLAQSKESVADLRVAVTSPGGTTEAALKQLLTQNGLPDLMLKTMQAAAKRAKELS